jgi:hypothetical protein
MAAIWSGRFVFFGTARLFSCEISKSGTYYKKWQPEDQADLYYLGQLNFFSRYDLLIQKIAELSEVGKQTDAEFWSESLIKL